MTMELPEVQQLRRDVEMANLQIRKLHSLLMNTRRHAFTASAMAKCAASGRPARGLVEFHAQFGEDCVLYELFEGKREGFFIEAGAFNGVDFSVSYAFEQLGWNGLLVEAIPERAEECRRNRPHAQVAHAAIGARGGPDSITFAYTADMYGGMLSHRADTTDATFPEISPTIARTNVTVPMTTLDALLEKHQGPIDFVLLDLEGGEAAALQGFDLAKYKPRVLMIEDGKLGQNSPMCEYMKTQPYKHVGWLEINAIYIRNEEIGLMKRSEKMAVFGW